MRCRASGLRHSSVLAAMVIIIAMTVAASPGVVAGAPWDGYGFYFGNLHSHTSYSDGVLTPTDAFQVARDAAGLDFLAVTDHGYYMQESTNMHMWHRAHEEADAMYEPGVFVPLVGFEWTFTDGHMNGLGTAVAGSRDTQRDMQAFIDFLVYHDGIGVFNHPSYDMQPNWNDFEYRGDADRQTALLEVGSGSYAHNISNERAYRRALDRGWAVGAASNQDNHRANWGTVAPTRTGVAAETLTREGILEALRSMRTYATEDRNVRVLFTCEGQPMGSDLNIVRATDGSALPMEFRAFIDDPDATDRLASVEIVANGAVVWEDGPFNPGTCEVTVELAPKSSYSWFYLRATQADGDLVVSSPIWITSGTGIAACDIAAVGMVPQVGREMRVEAEIVNRNVVPMSGCIATLFACGEWGREIAGSVQLDLPAGRGSHLEFAYTPTHVGECAFELSVESGAGAADVFPGVAMMVRAADIPRIVIDEGHNNRYSGYMDRLVGLLADAGRDPVLSSGRVSSELLDDADVLVVNMPERGFALTPTEFSDEELNVMAGFVRRGGSLLIAGWSPSDDGSRDAGDLNDLLGMVDSTISFEVDGVSVPELSDICVASWGAGRLRAEEARALRVGGSSARVIATVDIAGEVADAAVAAQIPFAVIEQVGAGRIAVQGAPVYSDYDLFREGYSNARFTMAIIDWLCGEEWSGR